MDEERIDIAWDMFIDILIQETQSGCDGASDEYLLGIIKEKIQQTFKEINLKIGDFSRNKQPR